MHIERREVTEPITKEEYFSKMVRNPKSIEDFIKNMQYNYHRRLKINTRKPGGGIMWQINNIDSKNHEDDDYEYYKITGYENIYICSEREWKKIAKAGGIEKYFGYERK